MVLHLAAVHRLAGKPQYIQLQLQVIAVNLRKNFALLALVYFKVVYAELLTASLLTVL